MSDAQAPHGAPLTLFDSMARAERPFVPLDPTNVRIYSCGPTVYNFAHLGNLRAYVFTDTLRRTFELKRYPVTHVINITDVGHLTSDADAGEDKMELAAAGLGKDIWEVAAFYTAAFKADIAALNIRSPSRWSVATDHIAEMIAFAERIAPAHCYEIESGLYFDVTTVPEYGRLARSIDDVGESRIDPVSGKRHAADFAIWRRSPPGEQRQMEWNSPWGRGAPGWHLECSVMSGKYLGLPFDIHTGGIDHREIHHPNEIAQNQAFCGCADSGAKFWMHNNFLVDRTGKMSKSSGSFLTLRWLVDRGVHPLAYRLLCLGAHYRSELEFSVDTIGAALVRLKRLVKAVEQLRAKAAAKLEVVADGRGQPYLDQLDRALSNDLNTPQALPVLDALLGDAKLSPAERLACLAGFDDALGLQLATLSRADLSVRPADAALTAEAVEARLAERDIARKAKDFATSDAIRAELDTAGVELMDGDPLRWEWRAELGA